MIQRLTIVVLITLIFFTLLLVPISHQVSAESTRAESGNLLMTGPVYMKDINGHWAERYMDKMLRKTIAYGFLDQTFRPDQPMSRLDVAIMLAKGLGLETWKTAEDSLDKLLPFSDLSTLTTEQKRYVYIVSGLGLMIGDQAGTFRPHDAITRDEFATLLVRALGYERETESDQVDTITLPFADKKEIPQWAYPYVQVAWDHQLMIGYEENGVETFKPKRQITRAEVTTVISRIDAMTVSSADDPVRIGSVAEVDASVSQLTLVTAEGQRYVLSVRSDAAVYVGGKESTLTQVKAGMRAEVIIDGNGRVSYLEAGYTLDQPDEILQMVKGTVMDNGWNSVSTNSENTAILRVKKDDGTTFNITLKSDTSVYIGDETSRLIEIQKNARVSVIVKKESDGTYVAKEVRVFSQTHM
ncbi:MAG: S-layer homology domain-containing protein [Bacillaceae bacterium]|nr:S-layer homology domain-containing protein [Bacillaceae bacterium]